jgi:hypothetical protein
MAMVEARFYVSGYERAAWDPAATTVKLQAVSRGEHNRDWASATPNGSVQMTIRNEGAAGFFVDRLGKEIAITFTEAPEELSWSA